MSTQSEPLPPRLEIRVPGSFVVLQGLPGDGLANTMDSLPRLLSVDASANNESHHNDNNAATATVPPLGNVIGSSPSSSGTRILLYPNQQQQPGLVAGGAVVGSSGAGAATASSFCQQPTEVVNSAMESGSDNDHDSFIVVDDDGDDSTAQHGGERSSNSSSSRKMPRRTESSSPARQHQHPIGSNTTTPGGGPMNNSDTTTSTSTSSLHHQLQQQMDQQQMQAAQAAALGEWRDECWRQQCDTYNEWHENNLANRRSDYNNNNNSSSSSSLHDGAVSHHHHHHVPLASAWWLGPNGQLALLDRLPTPNNSRNTTTASPPPRVLGTLAAGSTIVATGIVTIASDTLEPLVTGEVVSCDATTEAMDDAAAAAAVHPAGQPGWIQLLQVDASTALGQQHDDDDDDVHPKEQQQDPLRDGNNNRHSKTAYVVLSRDGYSYLGPGLPTTYLDSSWIWRVTCIDGAYVRAGLELSTDHLATLPYGSLVHVRRKTINVMGLSRLQVVAWLGPRRRRRPSASSSGRALEERGFSCFESERFEKDGNNSNDDDWTSECISGWCSEFLNPQSGQQGSIVEPLPFCVPALYRVSDVGSEGAGAIIRSGIELSHPQIGHAPPGAILTITGRAFSEHPAERCIERLRLAGNGGWISLRLNKSPPHDSMIAEMCGLDPTFDPNEAGKFHLEALRRVRMQLQEGTTRGTAPSRSEQQEQHPMPLLVCQMLPSRDEERLVSLEALQRTQQQNQGAQTTRTRVSHIISSVAEEEERSASSSLSSLGPVNGSNSNSQSRQANTATGAPHGTSNTTTRPSTPPRCTYNMAAAAAIVSPTPAAAAAGSSTTLAHEAPAAAAGSTPIANARSSGSSPGPMLVDRTKPPPNYASATCLCCLTAERTATIIHGGTGHISCCLTCARILKGRGDPCPVCRLPIDAVIQHFWA